MTNTFFFFLENNRGQRSQHAAVHGVSESGMTWQLNNIWVDTGFRATNMCLGRANGDEIIFKDIQQVKNWPQSSTFHKVSGKSLILWNQPDVSPSFKNICCHGFIPGIQSEDSRAQVHWTMAKIHFELRNISSLTLLFDMINTRKY